MIQKSFPSLPIEFYEILKLRAKENGFSDERFIDAATHVIDTCIYPTPTIANFISYDRKVKLHTYADMLKMTNELGAEIWKSYKQVSVPGRTKPVWVLIGEAKYFEL